MNAGWTSGLVAVGVLLVLGLLRTAANRPTQRDILSGDLVLQPSSMLVWTMGIIAVGAPVAIAVLQFIYPVKNEREGFAVIGMVAFFLLVGGLVWFWAIRRRTRLNVRGLTSEYMLASPRFLAWEDVTKVSFSNGQEFAGKGSSAACIGILTGGSPVRVRRDH